MIGEIDYHPLRARRFFARDQFDAAQQWIDHVRKTDAKRASLMSLSDAVMMDVIEELETAGVERVELEAIKNGAQATEAELQFFMRHGSIVFDISQRTKRAFGFPVDLNQPIDDWKLPAESFYLHWGREAGLTSPFAGVVVEGCYVTQARGKLGERECIMINAVCTFEDPQRADGLPLAQEFRRFARQVDFLFSDGGRTVSDQMAEQLESSDMSQLWNPLAPEILAACLSALAFVRSEIKPDGPFIVGCDDPDLEEAILGDLREADERVVQEAIGGLSDNELAQVYSYREERL